MELFEELDGTDESDAGDAAGDNDHLLQAAPQQAPGPGCLPGAAGARGARAPVLPGQAPRLPPPQVRHEGLLYLLELETALLFSSWHCEI